ncbi:MAG: PAS domain-containing protein [Rickettsiaceae bacterium H1]|nr:PAS domain-containing protein [Rickettsiaceae bacterium H1]
MFAEGERRFTNLLCEYWNELRGDRAYPDLREVNRDHLSDVWDYCFIVKYVDNKYKVVHIGEGIKDAYESDLNIASDAPIIQFDNIENIECYLEEVLESGEAVIEESECYDLKGNKIKFRQCFLPLGKNEEMVDGVIGALRYKIV